MIAWAFSHLVVSLPGTLATKFSKLLDFIGCTANIIHIYFRLLFMDNMV